MGIVALPHDTDLFRLRITTGRWLQQGAGVAEVVMNRQAVELYGNPAVGSNLPLNIGGRALMVKLVGIIDELEKSKIYIDQSLYDAFANPKHHINSLMFVAKD